MLRFLRSPSVLVLLLLGAACLQQRASCQVFELDKQQPPLPKHILKVYRFYVYASGEQPPLSLHGHPVGLVPYDPDADVVVKVPSTTHASFINRWPKQGLKKTAKRMLDLFSFGSTPTQPKDEVQAFGTDMFKPPSNLTSLSQLLEALNNPQNTSSVNIKGYTPWGSSEEAKEKKEKEDRAKEEEEKEAEKKKEETDKKFNFHRNHDSHTKDSAPTEESDRKNYLQEMFKSFLSGQLGGETTTTTTTAPGVADEGSWAEWIKEYFDAGYPAHPPVLYFDHVRLANKSQAVPDLTHYRSVELTVMTYDDFWQKLYPISVDPNRRYCCTQDDVYAGLCRQDHIDRLIFPPDVSAVRTVVTAHARLKYRAVPKTGVYVLLYSNCGSKNVPDVDGRVVLRNSYGYLPGVEVAKVPFYLVLAWAYGGLLGVWLLACIRHFSQRITMHYWIGTVILTGLVESLLWLSFYRYWNTYAHRSAPLLVFSILSSVTRNILSLMLVLVASLGWGITRPSLERSTICKVQGIVVSYFVFDAIRQTVSQFRLSHDLSTAVVFCCLIPISLLQAVIFLWVFGSLSRLCESLSAAKQHEKLQVFKKLYCVLISAAILAIVFLITQIVVMARDLPAKWSSEWAFSDAVPHLFFFAVLVAMVCLWFPSRTSKRMAYSQELPGDEESAEALEGVSLAALGTKVAPSSAPRDIRVFGKENLNVDMEDSEEEKEVSRPPGGV